MRRGGETGERTRPAKSTRRHPFSFFLTFWRLRGCGWMDWMGWTRQAPFLFLSADGDRFSSRLSVPLPREARKKRNWESGQLDRVYTVCWREYGIYHVYGTGHRLASNYSKSLRRSGDIRSRQQFVLDLRFSKEFRSVLTFHSPLTAWR